MRNTTKMLLAAVIAACTSCTQGNKSQGGNTGNDAQETADTTHGGRHANKQSDNGSLKYPDFTALATDNSEHRLSEYIKPGKYAMIDFWASWCGPCRAAIPHVRSIYKKYGGRLNIIAVSLDRKESAWREAMEQEQMEWPQLWAADEMAEDISRAYRIKGIPYMLLINGTGEIVFAGHDPQQIDALLEEIFKDNR